MEADDVANLGVWTFFGRIVPERVPVQISELGIKAAFGDISADVKFLVCDSQIKATATSNSEVKEFDLQELIRQSIQEILDYNCLFTGIASTVEITTAVNEKLQRWRVFPAGLPVLAKKSEDIISLTSDNINLLLYDHGVSRALSDFREAILKNGDTGFYCYRAIEALMQCCRDRKSNDAVEWQNFRDRIGVSREDIQEVKKFSDDVRHGKSIPITWDERASILTLTQGIIIKFLQSKQPEPST